MRANRLSGWRRMLGGAFVATLTAAGVLAIPSAAQAEPPRAVWIKFDEVPRPARETIDRERGHHDLKQILRIRQDGKTYYRAIIDTRGDDKLIFVSEGGRLFKVGEVPDLEVGRGSFEKWVDVRELPRAVRETLDREAGRHEVKQIWFVRRNNREFYRAIIDTRGDDLAVRIGPSGKLLAIDEVEDFAVGSVESRRFEPERERWTRIDDLPRPVRRAIEDEMRGREIRQVVYVERGGRVFYRVISDDKVIRISDEGYVYRDREIEDVTYGAEKGDSRYGQETWIKYAELPRDVKETLDRERRGKDVKQIFYVRKGHWVYYRAIIDTRGDDLAVRISESGKLLSREEVEDVAIGTIEVKDYGAREEWVKYATLPRAARETLDRERGRDEVLKIVRVESGGRFYYRCLLDTRPHPVMVRIDESGRLIR